MGLLGARWRRHPAQAANRAGSIEGKGVLPKSMPLPVARR